MALITVRPIVVKLVRWAGYLRPAGILDEDRRGSSVRTEIKKRKGGFRFAVNAKGGEGRLLRTFRENHRIGWHPEIFSLREFFRKIKDKET